MNISTDIKLDFNDVLIQPKKTYLKSRSDVNLIREFKFPKYKQLSIPKAIFAVALVIFLVTKVSPLCGDS